MRQCLLLVRKLPGANNSEIARALSMTHKGQVSRVLNRLGQLGLLVKQPLGPGHLTKWRATVAGERVAGALLDSLPDQAL